ncbi:MAG: hypothetical protein ACUVRV_08980 [Cyanobacteriota bacterium]
MTVFAPTDPTTPWQEGQTDANGQFILQPDPELVGLWQVRIRQAGHGAIVNVPVGEISEPTSAQVAAGPSAVATSSSSSFGLLQRGVMTACVIWGCLGTALFFSTPRNPKPSLREGEAQSTS